MTININERNIFTSFIYLIINLLHLCKVTFCLSDLKDCCHIKITNICRLS